MKTLEDLFPLVSELVKLKMFTFLAFLGDVTPRLMHCVCLICADH